MIFIQLVQVFSHYTITTYKYCAAIIVMRISAISFIPLILSGLYGIFAYMSFCIQRTSQLCVVQRSASICCFVGASPSMLIAITINSGLNEANVFDISVSVDFCYVECQRHWCVVVVTRTRDDSFNRVREHSLPCSLPCSCYTWHCDDSGLFGYL